MKNVMGRPKLGPQVAKGEIVAVRFSPPEIKEIKAAVKRSGKNKSEWVRNCLLTAARSA